jgi:hypothetical protein
VALALQKEAETPTDIRIIHAHDFIKVTTEGQLDLENSRKLLLEVASASAPLVDYGIVVDTRKTMVTMFAVDLWYLAQDLVSVGKTFLHRTAVLCPLERFDDAGFFALCAQNRGLEVRAFASFEDAIEWLIAKRT